MTNENDMNNLPAEAWEPLQQQEKDAERLTGAREHVMRITKGMFYAAFPRDGHQPVSHTQEEQQFVKIVMKLPVKA